MVRDLVLWICDPLCLLILNLYNNFYEIHDIYFNYNDILSQYPVIESTTIPQILFSLILYFLQSLVDQIPPYHPPHNLP